MTAVIMPPNDEIFFADLQKELIALLFADDRIIYSQVPLWIEIGDFELNDKSQIKQVEIGELCVDENSVYCPVRVIYNECEVAAKLTLVCLHKGKTFTREEVATLKEKPARQVNVFRLGLVADQGPHAKSISKSVWCKLHNA